MIATHPSDYLSLLAAGADIALTAPQPEELLHALAAAAAESGRRLTIHRAELVDLALLRKITQSGAGSVTLQFSHADDAPRAGKD